MDDGLWQTLSCGLAAEPPVSIRLNPFKSGEAECAEGVSGGIVPWCKDSGRYLAARPAFTFDPLLHAGVYYVQEASSMFLDAILRQYVGEEPVLMLDLCAAPGGKSTVARAVLPYGSLLVSNEPVRSRAQVLAENMMKFGHQDVIVTNNYPQDFRRSGLMFDIILADVPCSGEGMFRKGSSAADEWSLQNVEKCWRLQREIVGEVWPCLREGGMMIYSTCTFNLKENEQNVRYIAEELGAEVLPVNVNDGWGITGSLLTGWNEPVCRFLPGLTCGEGLFMAVLRKKGGNSPYKNKISGRKNKAGHRQVVKSTGIKPDLRWLKQPQMFDFVRNGDVFNAIPKSWRDVYDAASRSLRLMTAGVQVGEVKGKDIIPAQGLALSLAFNGTVFPHSELDYVQAVSYLRKEAVTLPPAMPCGYVIVTFKGVPLGFEKNIGNRANNLYPAEWRIKSTHVPDAYNEVVHIKINN